LSNPTDLFPLCPSSFIYLNGPSPLTISLRAFLLYSPPPLCLSSSSQWFLSIIPFTVFLSHCPYSSALLNSLHLTMSVYSLFLYHRHTLYPPPQSVLYCLPASLSCSLTVTQWFTSTIPLTVCIPFSLSRNLYPLCCHYKDAARHSISSLPPLLIVFRYFLLSMFPSPKFLCFPPRVQFTAWPQRLNPFCSPSEALNSFLFSAKSQPPSLSINHFKVTVHAKVLLKAGVLNSFLAMLHLHQCFLYIFNSSSPGIFSDLPT
jgi:hypothetical protein